MFTNTDCTLYLYNKNGKMECYTRVPVRGVYWEDVNHATFLRTGQKNAVTALVVIPAENLNAHLRFTHGKDIIVKGIVDNSLNFDEQAALSQALATLRASHDCLTITTVDERMYGGIEVQHYELSCK